jgi:hypothetical protein
MNPWWLELELAELHCFIKQPEIGNAPLNATLDVVKNTSEVSPYPSQLDE